MRAGVRAGAAVAHVFSHALGEEERLLRNVADDGTQLGLPDAPQIHAAQAQGAGFRIVEAQGKL
jgi:hypothetical protein